jgi:hypothetical protein
MEVRGAKKITKIFNKCVCVYPVLVAIAFPVIRRLRIAISLNVKSSCSATSRRRAALSPAQCAGIVKHRIEGNPDPKYVSTSYAERNNLNVRMHSRRLTTLTNAFSKKWQSRARDGAVLQFRPHPPNAQSHSRDGGWRHQSPLGNEGRCDHARSMGSCQSALTAAIALLGRF